MKRKFAALRSSVQLPQRKKPYYNMPTNPLSVAGGWKKDTPSAEKSNPNDATKQAENVPRSVTGTVNEAGEIVDESGKSIGKIADSSDPKELAGNTVNEAGNIVSEAGDVLGKTTLGGDDAKVDETTKSTEKAQDSRDAAQDTADKTTDDATDKVDDTTESAGEYITEGGDSKSSSGWFGKTAKGAYNTLGSFGSKGKEASDDVQEQTGETTEQGVQDTKNNTEETAQEGAEDPEKKLDDTAQDTKDTADETAEDSEKKLDETTEDAQKGAQDTQEGTEDPEKKLDDTVKDVNDTTEETAQDGAEDSEKKLDDTNKDAQGAAQDTAEETVPEGAEDPEKKIDDTTEDAQDKVEDAQDEASQALDFSILENATVNKGGNLVIDGKTVGKLVEGEPKKLQGCKSDEQGQIWNDSGKIVGKAEPLPQDDAEQKEDPPFKNFPDAIVRGDGSVVQSENNDTRVGTLVEGDPKKLKGSKVDEDGDVLDGQFNKVGKAEPWDEPEPEEAPEEEAPDWSFLDGCTVNKGGKLVNKQGEVVGTLKDGNPKELQGHRCDAKGQIWNDSGSIVGHAEPVSDSERQAASKSFSPFENFPDAVVEADGSITSDGKRVGTLVEGEVKRLKGSKVDEDGDILDRFGNAIGKAEPWDEPEPEEEEVDRSILAGKRVNKAGNVVDGSGVIYGKVVEGNVPSMVGRMCNKQGQILSESGDVLGQAEVVSEGEREGSKEGPFAELEGLTVAKDGTIVTPGGDIVGRLTSGDGKTLFGRPVDQDGEIVDKNGNTLGKAERWSPPEDEKKPKGPMEGLKVNREGNVVNNEGETIGKLVSGDLSSVVGKEIDADGDIINTKGQTVGHVALIQDIPQEEAKETEEARQAREKTEAEEKKAEDDRQLAGQLSGAIEQSLEKIQPILNMIKDKMAVVDNKKSDEIDQEQLVKEVKPLIEEGGKILQETNGIVRGMDPDGRIQRQAKQKSGTKDASPEEHHLAEVLKTLTGDVTQTVDGAKRKLESLPKAKKELNPLWGLLTEPLGQIIAAVGLLLTGVLGIVGRLLSGLGLGNLVDGLLGGLGLNKVLSGLGLGSAYDALTGKTK
ncbi:uncharacterized protein F5Z01DRAFT_123771 [Emericellopsis atlantica]|uniref:DUF6987 domain-containing protein n=1 Tax=Emericellopsis atlantica TaxID=2614577 RepID=A0A9P7ZKN1_9HYPO|nr:uncharacterized protein F5Z01DRAFT_123771 [Emericellopsis atlantica]KAG9253691.1 hypothetical protein F5Z01DRAFT_123771 [Emericellopsis atlantica]